MAKNLYKDVSKTLEDNNCFFKRNGAGSHQVWFSPITNRHFTVATSVKSRHPANAIMKQAGLPKHF